MGIILHAIKAEPSSSGNRRTEPKARYKNADLPFTNYKDDLRLWQSAVVAAVIDWAGSLDDPWAVGAHPDFDGVVEKWWTASFPAIPIDKAVYAVVCCMSWSLHFHLSPCSQGRLCH
jgi:hypothetical protein